MIWKWIINLMLGHRVQLLSNFLHGSHQEVYAWCCISAAFVSPTDTLSLCVTLLIILPPPGVGTLLNL